jgi:two-component system, response regulator YesN
MYKLLIADDEPMIRKGLQKLAEQSGQPITQIRTVANGVEALQAMEQERPDFLFTDIRMPKMDGLELCKQMNQLDWDTQIVVISGYSDFEYAQRCVSYGVKEYLLKPVSVKAVHDVLAKLVKHSTKDHARTFVAVTRLETWANGLEEAIWSLKEEQLSEQAAEMLGALNSYGLKLEQLKDVLQEMHTLLMKRLHTRDVFQLHSELDLQGTEDAETGAERFRLMLASLVQELKVKRRGKLKDPVEEAKSYIEEHLSEEVSLEEVAEHIGLNSSYFSQLFKQSTQETFVQYRTRRRMEKAKKLLEQPHYRITDISGEVGYSDHPHFTKTFKKYTGLLPSEYRQQLGMD